MLPWGHLAVGYFVYTVLVRTRVRRAPDGVPTIVLLIGTQLPDLVDKPLNWWFGILDGRGIAHSLLVVIAVCGLAVVVASAYDRTDVAGALSVGLLSHLLADAWHALLSGQFGRAAFLVWPLLPAPTYPKDTPTDHLAAWLDQLRLLPAEPVAFLTGAFGFQLVLFCIMLGVWAADGAPGLGATWRFLTRTQGGSLRL